MQTLLFISVFLILVGLFAQNYFDVDATQADSPVELTFKEWLKHTWLEIILNLLCYTAFCFGIDIGLAQKGIEVAVEGVEQTALIAMFTAAFATATAIKKLVQLTLLPIFSKIIKARSAKKLLRDKMKYSHTQK